LSRAAAERLHRFDVGVDTRDDVQEDWLDVTHRLTFVEAVRRVVSTWPDPLRWRLLLFASHFVAGARPLDGPRPDTSPRPGTAAALAAALRARDADEAVGIAAGLAARGDCEGIRGVLDAACLADGAVRGIVVAHLVKTSLAAFAETTVTGDPTPLLAAVRLFASPVMERRVGRRVREAIRLVRDGKPPERLTD
jgi:hypothetical protein